MNGDMFEQLIESVTQADDIIKGKAKPFRATEFAEPQVKAIRAKTGLSQTRFADVLGWRRVATVRQSRRIVMRGARGQS